MMKRIFLAGLTLAGLALGACERQKETSVTEMSAREGAGVADAASAPGVDMISPDSVLTVADFSKVVIKLSDTTAMSNKARTVEKATSPRVRVVINSIAGYGADEAFAKAAAQTLEEVINSPEFEPAVLREAYAWDEGLTPVQLYARIMAAHEEDGPGGEDGVINLRLRTITRQEDGGRWVRACGRSTIGIDGGGTGIAAVCPEWLHTQAINGDKGALAAHFIHEYMHILGFTHPDKKLESVPYKIHAIVEKLAKNMPVGTARQ
jgi:hypothetical protein